MAEAKTIKLLLSNGSLSGLLVAELLKWDGILFSSPRESYHLLSNELESKFWGVYLLVSEDKVYIGQANDLLRRIGEHDKSKDWWEKVVLFTTKDNSLNRSDIDYLENKLIDIAKNTGTLEMNNVQIGNSPKVSRYRETELKDFLDGALLLLELIGIKVFTKHTIKKIKKTTESIKVTIDKEHHFDQVMNKRRAISFLLANNFDFSDGVVSFASLQENKKHFWANPKVDFLDKKWYLILNNQFNKELIVLEVPPKSFSLKGDKGNNRLLTRSDKPIYIDLNLRESLLTDLRTNADFSLFVKKVIKY
ncbi:MAG: GIY-YIG nuclease family protein [Flavobacteriaceae bacterium]